MPAVPPTTDGLVTIRAPEPGDAAALVAGRDDEFHRFLGDGAAEPRPSACIVVSDEVVGWVDYDDDARAWLGPGEVNVGYNVLAPHRGRGYGVRAVQLLMHHLAVATDVRTATLLIDPANARSLAVARRAGFTPHGDVHGERFFKRPAPPLVYTDDVATMRLDADAARSSGPRWTFAVELADGGRVATIECHLADGEVGLGEAALSYRANPGGPAEDLERRAVDLVVRFVADHTGARRADLVDDHVSSSEGVRQRHTVWERPAAP